MEIVGPDNEKIDSMDAWAKLYESPRSARQWRKFRSAYSVADFILNRDGGAALQARLGEALAESVTLERAFPEREVRFDEFGHGRVHDLGIYGRTNTGKSVFVGVEAKVDERFGRLVREVYLLAKARQITGTSTNAPVRMEQLLKRHFREPDPSMFEVRYQLLYATAGTLAAGADVSALYIVVFKTPLYNEIIAAENYRDYAYFMAKTGAVRMKLRSKEVMAHKLQIGEKELVCLYEYFELDS